MIVARQFIAWNVSKKKATSRRDGMSPASRSIHRPRNKNVLSTESYRSLRDGTCFSWLPGTSDLATIIYTRWDKVRQPPFGILPTCQLNRSQIFPYIPHAYVTTSGTVCVP